MNECYHCGFNDEDYGCLCPHSDKWYACPIEAKKEENIQVLTQEPCGDAISREELIEALNTWDKFGYAPTNELVPLRGNVDKDKYVLYIHYDDVIECIKGMPSVIKQPCGDAISRQAVLDIINFEDKWLLDTKSHNADTNIAFSAIKAKISELASVNPNRKTE